MRTHGLLSPKTPLDCSPASFTILVEPGKPGLEKERSHDMTAVYFVFMLRLMHRSINLNILSTLILALPKVLSTLEVVDIDKGGTLVVEHTPDGVSVANRPVGSFLTNKSANRRSDTE